MTEHGGVQEWVSLVDVGNTHTIFGVYQGGELRESLRLSTDRERTSDEYGALLLPLLAHLELAAKSCRAVLISSVVPTLNQTLERLSEKYFGRAPSFVDTRLDIGMEILYDQPAEVGADRIVNAVAAIERYGAPVVVADFGTATTFDVVDENGAYLGGVIAPGLAISAEALFSKASKLYRVDIRRPDQVVGRNTAHSMQSGIYYGYIGLVDGILVRLREQMPTLEKVVATGGLSELIATGSEHIDVVDRDLTLHGLVLLYERNAERL